jgi:hypothetical protein
MVETDNVRAQSQTIALSDFFAICGTNLQAKSESFSKKYSPVNQPGKPGAGITKSPGGDSGIEHQIAIILANNPSKSYLAPLIVPIHESERERATTTLPEQDGRCYPL